MSGRLGQGRRSLACRCRRGCGRSARWRRGVDRANSRRPIHLCRLGDLVIIQRLGALPNQIQHLHLSAVRVRHAPIIGRSSAVCGVCVQFRSIPSAEYAWLQPRPSDVWDLRRWSACHAAGFRLMASRWVRYLQAGPGVRARLARSGVVWEGCHFFCLLLAGPSQPRELQLPSLRTTPMWMSRRRLRVAAPDAAASCRSPSLSLPTVVLMNYVPRAVRSLLGHRVSALPSSRHVSALADVVAKPNGRRHCLMSLRGQQAMGALYGCLSAIAKVRVPSTYVTFQARLSAPWPIPGLLLRA